MVACSRRSDSGGLAKNKAGERAGKKRGDPLSSPPVSPRFFPALSLASFFARAPLSERLEQAIKMDTRMDGSVLAVLAAYQNNLVTSKMMTSQVVQCLRVENVPK